MTNENRQAIHSFVERLKSGEIELEHVRCPNCRADDDELLFNRDRYGIPWNTVICRVCGMLYSNPQMTSKSTNEFYVSDDYRRIYGGGDLLRDSSGMFDFESVDQSADYHRLTHFDFVMESTGQIESVAELGAGGGWNLLPFISKGIRCQGYDFSPKLVDAGRQQGIDMFDLSSEGLSGRYDLIMLRHVLEHVDDPVKRLSQLSPHLTLNGQLFIEVPGIVRKIPSIQNAHYHYFSEETLDSVLGQAGFDVVARKKIERNGYLLMLAKPRANRQLRAPCHSGGQSQDCQEIEAPAVIAGGKPAPLLEPSEYRRVMRVISEGRRGMFKAAIADILPSPLKRIAASLRNR